MLKVRILKYLLVGMLFVSGIAWGQSNFVLLTHDYYIGYDQLQITSNPADFIVSGTPAVIKVSAFGFDCYFAGPNGTNLDVGEYPNSVRYPANGSAPGLDISNSGRQILCDTDCGGFQIKEIHADDNGQVDRLWITFSNRCNCSIVGGGQIRGEVRFNSQLADQAVPYLTCPSNIVVSTPYGQNSTMVTFPAPEGTPGAWINCQPPSGSVFSAGTNVVVTHFLYGTNAMTCTFTVTVQVEPFTLALVQSFPTGDLFIPAGGNLHLGVTATTDAFDSIASITLLSSTNVLLVVTNPPPVYSAPGGFLGYFTPYNWYNVPAGYYAFQAIAENSSGLLGTSAVLNITARVNLLQNGGFETGDFSDWTLVGTAPALAGPYNTVQARGTGYSVVHSGSYGAFLGDINVASLSQIIPTIPGQYYVLSLWLDNLVNGTNQVFNVIWDTDRATNMVLSMTNPPAFSWTKLQSLVFANGTNTTVQLQAENAFGYFGLDDVYVTPVPPPVLQSSTTRSNSVQLTWITAPGLAYQIQYTTNLVQTNWRNLQPPFVATSSNSTILDTNSLQRFYRLSLP